MPFLDHFGLTEYPFGLTPNARLYYPTEQVKNLLAGLEFAIMRGDGLLKVVGEVGTGKTMIIRLLMARLAELDVNTAYLSAPIIDAEFLPASIAQEFGIKVVSKGNAFRQLQKFLVGEYKKEKHCVLIVDEAQALGAEGLETIRLLSNVETETDKLLQIVLVGQRELDDILHQAEVRQIAQRIQFSFVTRPMSADMVADYVRFRLEHCLKPDANRSIFTPHALRYLARASQGLPRIVHLLADKALIAAYAEGEKEAHTSHVRTALRETPDVRWSIWRYLF